MNDTSLTPDALAQACAKQMYSTDDATQHLGIEILEVKSGQAKLKMPVQDYMLNGHKICHGGYIFLLADTAFAFACNTYNQVTVAQHCAVIFLRPGQAGSELTATAIERTKTSRSGIYDITVRDQDETIIAEFRGHSRSLDKPILPNS